MKSKKIYLFFLLLTLAPIVQAQGVFNISSAKNFRVKITGNVGVGSNSNQRDALNLSCLQELNIGVTDPNPLVATGVC